MTAYLLLAALAWAVASRGGTSMRDLVIVLGLLVVAMIVGRAWPQRDVPLWTAFAVLMGWLVILGPLRTGPTLETVRLPLLVLITAVTTLLVRRMSARERNALVTGLMVVGCLQSVIALGELMVTIPFGLPSAPRAGALLGSPNALGMLLVATAVLTAREVQHRGGWLPAAALLLQGSALLSTGSRAAILIVSALLVGYVATHTGRKRALLAAAALAGAASVVIWRTTTDEYQDRPHLWLESLRRIADQPLLGSGPAPSPFTSASPDTRITTYAHNELLQWGMEYGLVGIGLALIVMILALRFVVRPLNGDRWLQAAAFAVLMSGLTDFTLRITALTLTGAALTALALTGHKPADTPAAALPQHAQ